MKIKIYAIGKIKDFYKSGCDEYIKRLSSYSKVEVIEVKDEPASDKPNESEITKIKNIEGERVIKLLKPNEYLIGLDLNKKELDSVEFSKYLKNKIEENGSSVSFVIGGSYGLSDELKRRVNDSLSFMTQSFDLVYIPPKEIEFTVMFLLASLEATFFIYPTTPALLAT